LTEKRKTIKIKAFEGSERYGERRGMLVKDIMSYNVVTTSGDTYVLDAERTMEFHKISRLPVVDKGKLVGIVTKDDILKASPSATTPFNQRQLFYLMSKLTVKEIMKTKVLTVSPGETIEKAVIRAQKNKIGSLPVVEGDRVVGIITTTDVFRKIMNPLLGIGETGRRIMVSDVVKEGLVPKVMDYIYTSGARVQGFWVPPDGRFDLVLHLDTDDIGRIISDLEKMGFQVVLREHSA
jgi:acetoin utilization protein AcuB